MMIKQPYLEEILQELNETFENFDQMAEKLALEMFIGNKKWSAT